MKPSDYQEFKAVIDRDCERRGKPLFSGGLLQEMFEDLEDISLDQFLFAAKCHRRSDTGQFGLTVASIRKQLGVKNVQDLTWVDVIAMAKAKNSPLAISIIANKYLVSYDLNNNSDIENRGNAELFLADLPKIISRLESGQFTNHELVLCGKYGLNPKNGICEGHSVLPDYSNLAPRIEKVKESQAWALMIQEKRSESNRELPAPNPEGLKKLKSLILEIIEPEKQEIAEDTESLKIEFKNNLEGLNDE